MPPQDNKKTERVFSIREEQSAVPLESLVQTPEDFDYLLNRRLLPAFLPKYAPLNMNNAYPKITI